MAGGVAIARDVPWCSRLDQFDNVIEFDRARLRSRTFCACAMTLPVLRSPYAVMLNQSALNKALDRTGLQVTQGGTQVWRVWIHIWG